MAVLPHSRRLAVRRVSGCVGHLRGPCTLLEFLDAEAALVVETAPSVRSSRPLTDDPDDSP